MTRGPARRPRDTDLTPSEQANVRTALRFLRTRCGGWAPLAKVLGFAHTHLADTASGRSAGSASMTFRIARLAKVTVDDVLTGRFPDSRACAHCGCVPPEAAE